MAEPSILEILEDKRRVLLGGQEIALGARAFDVLAYLFRHAERTVSKAELLDHVWSGMTVEEGNLSVQIAGLRKAIGRDAIKTVPGVGYRLILEAPPAAIMSPGPAVPDIPSLAVLPFTNLTGSADKDYLVDGIVNEITAALGRVGSFFVVSTTSSFTYKGHAVDLAQVGAELGVRYVLEGSIQAAGDSLRIFTQLVEAETGRLIWQERFDGEMSGIFDLQDRVAEHVAGALEPKLIWAEAARATAKPTDSLTAYEVCLKAAPLVFKLHSTEALEQGLALLRQALALDPDYIQAKALYCYAHTSAFATRWWTLDQARAAMPMARDVINAETDDPLALGYVGHFIAYIGREYQEGLETLKRAERLNPNSATIAMLLGWVHVYLDQNEEAVAQLQRALRISPLHPHTAIINSGIGCALVHMGNLEASVPYFETAQASYPEFGSNALDLLGVYWALGRKDEAGKLVDFVRQKIPDFSVESYRRATPKLNPTHFELTREALLAFGVPET